MHSRLAKAPALQRFWLGLVLLLGGCARPAETATKAEAGHPLHWDTMEQRAEPRFEDGVAKFAFHVTNTADYPVKVYDVRPTCGCTTVDAPQMPWTIAPGASGTVAATVDFRGKEGEIAKQLLVGTVEGTQTLTMVIKVPPMSPEMRVQNQAIASANRQKVFQGDCAACHATPAESRYGDDLFEAVCAICHQAKNRASMVPDLAVAKEKRDTAWWTHWVEEGRDGSLMPAFAQSRGGPLTPPQVQSLVEYLVGAFPAEPKKS